MTSLPFSRMGLILALVVVGCECSRVKRQDLIPSPRVGKRTLLRSVDDRGDMGVLLEGVGGLNGLGVDVEENGESQLAAPAKLQASKSQASESDLTNVGTRLLPPVLKFVLADSTTAQDSNMVPRSFLKSRLSARQRKSYSSTAAKSPEFNPWLFRRLLQRLASIPPEDIEQYLRENITL